MGVRTRYINLSMNNFESYYLGEVPYRIALEWQKQQVTNVGRTQVGRILGLEHSAVITLGLRSTFENDLVSDEEQIAKQGIEIFRTDRGGETTLHSPGQLVIYPIIPLRVWGLGVREYVEALREITRLTLQRLGIRTVNKSDSEPGLYTDGGKIAFFGIRIQQGITSHGVSINIRNDLNLFSNIVSCGVHREKFDSFINHDINASPSEVFQMWTEEFRNHFTLTQASATTTFTHSRC